MNMSIIRSVLATCLGGVSLGMMMSTQLIAQSVTPIPAPEFLPMVSDTDIGASTVLVQKSFALQAGEMRRVFGRAEITSSVDSNVYVETYARCVGSDGTVFQPGGAAQNHEGNDTPVGQSYPWPGHLVLSPLLLFQAPATGTYTCELFAKKGTTADPGTGVQLTALARFNGDSTTWLQVSAANDVGASWWQNPPCDKDGDTSPSPTDGPSACLYLAGASNLQQLYVFDNDGSPANLWTAASDAAFVDASDSLMLTTCFYGTSSCTADNSQSWWSHYVWDIGVDGTAVDTYLELIQLNSAGGTCKVYDSPVERSWVGNAPHHYMIYHSLSTIPIYPDCGSRQFKLRISVKYVYGNPVKIDGPTFTHAFAINSYYGTALPVPNLIGLGSTAASNSITASGYAASTVSYSLSSAPAGSVIFQYPSAGVIELPGSGVELTLSTGGAIVPNLLGNSKSGATSTITALGLVPIVYSSKKCTDPGDVLLQSPPAGTLVALGSAVSVTVDSGTFKTCGIVK